MERTQGEDQHDQSRRDRDALAYDEFAAAGGNYQQMVDSSAAERCGTSEEIGEAGAFLLGEHAGFITGTDLLIDGGVIAAIRMGKYKLH